VTGALDILTVLMCNRATSSPSSLVALKCRMVHHLDTGLSTLSWNTGRQGGCVQVKLEWCAVEHQDKYQQY